MYWLARILGLTLAIVVLGYVIGLFLPAERTLPRVQLIDAPVERVYETITDVEGQPNWRSDIRGLTVERRGDLRLVYAVVGTDGQAGA